MDAPEALHDEPDDEWPTEADPIRVAIGPLVAAIVEATATDSPQRRAAMHEAFAAVERILAEIARPRLN
jgi:hypothetical protein